MSKYFSKKVTVDGLTFDSRREAERWAELQDLEERNLIFNLKRQVRIEIVPSQKENGKVVERPIFYVADFTYYDSDSNYVVEDVKPHDKDGKIPKYFRGTAAYKEYVIKRKLLRYLHGIKVVEV